jgi:hypothetical protein
MRTTPLLLAGVLATPATAGTISITLPQMPVAEYHKPYVAAWIEPVGGGAAQTVFVWYDLRKPNNGGAKWLADVRSWWRKSGRTLNLPADGLSGATRAPGTYKIPLPANLKSGAYTLFVEAARESGGREMVSLPITIPAKAASTSGKTELGAVTLAAR